MLAAFGISLLVTLAVVRTQNRQHSASLDHDLSGPQKFHAHAVPRIGGVGLLSGIVTALFIGWLRGDPAVSLGVLLVLCGLPAFAAGLMEDLTKQVSPARRLFFTAVSAALAGIILDSLITRTAIPGLDTLAAFTLGAFAITVFAVAGVANAINIIDGFNGLASMCGVLILATLAYVAFQAGDPMLASLCLLAIGALLGFFVWNFPAGLIFLGDGGAYFLGFFIAEIAVLLLHRNPTVSPMLALLVCIYPIFETVFSIYRRRFIRDVPPSMPDGIHLHSLIYRRLLKGAVGSEEAKALARRNSMTSPYLWLLCMTSLAPSMLFWDNTAALTVCIILFVVAYIVVYWRIVRFKTPRWMIMHRSRRNERTSGKGKTPT